MKTTFTLKICRFIVIVLMICRHSFAQNSILVNFGSSACNTVSPAFSLIKNPLTGVPMVLSTCDMSVQLPSYFNVFIAYNPLNNKIYVADNRNGIETKIWVLDIGLPSGISCPLSIPATPTYSYSYISNNFEFDNNGDLWSLSNYNSTTGQCNIDKFDVNTGNVISTRILQFPEGNFPTTIYSGDLTILPNGRMFASLGSGICRLYEITDYSSTTSNASATYLQTLPRDCYGIAYLNGLLELAGTDFNTTCYYYDYTIATNVLGAEKSFQNGQTPIDNTSFSPSVGSTKKLVCAINLDASTSDLTYELYLENMGNTILNNVNLTDDLEAAFGSGNVSNVSVSFVPGSNWAGLQLNPSYNGTTVTNILNGGQSLPNKVLGNTNYFFKVQVKCRIRHLSCGRVYLNSALATASIGSGLLENIIYVADSSNNGDSTMMDPNKNGNAGDPGENMPTPFAFRALPVRFIKLSASLIDNNTASVKWQVATPMENAAKFEIEISADGKNWNKAGELPVDNIHHENWQFIHSHIPAGNLYYRIRQIDIDAMITYSKIVLLNNKKGNTGYIIYPNPANNFITISSGYDENKKAVIGLYDLAGKLLESKIMISTPEEINITKYPSGNYLLKISHDMNVRVYKVIVKH